MRVILAIEIAYDKNWNYLWIETDSKWASMAFKSHNIVPWKLKNRWQNCVVKLESMHFMITRIYREGNHCVDKLANFVVCLWNDI